MGRKDDKEDPVALAEQTLLEVCSSVKLSKKKLMKKARSKCPSHVKEKHIKRARRKLEQRGLLVLSGNGDYYLVSKMESESDSGASSTDEEAEQSSSLPKGIPIAEILRRRAAQETFPKPKKASEVEDVDVDEEIRRLEAELEMDDDSDASNSEDNDDGETTRSKLVSFGATTVKEIPSDVSDVPKDGGEAIICLSTMADERIAPLPSACLPQSKKRTLKGIDSDGTNPTPKKRNVQVSNGLKHAVKEVLDGYVARSSERLPFYCRVCAQQLPNGKEFFQHKQSAFHKVAVEMERKASYCKLCRKQFTSPVQLKEHVTSRPHRERLQKVKLNNRPRQEQHVGQSKRQWC